MDVTSSIRSNVLSQSVVVTRTMDYWGRTGGISVVLPYRSLNASSDVFQASNQGISDVAFLWQVNIFGAPALTREQFRSYVPQPFASFHLFVATPLGKYEPAVPLNPSANRWTFFPTLNYSYTPDRGWTWLETYLSTKLFTANDDYRVGGASTLTQKPLFLVEGHASRNLTRAVAIGGRLLQHWRRDQHRWRGTRQRRKRSVKDACRRSPPGAMIGAWRRQQRKCPLSA